MWLEATYKRKNQEKDAVSQKQKTFTLTITPTKSPYVTPGSAFKHINLRITDNAISPKTITAKKDETIQITLFVDEGYHNFIQKEYGIATQKISQGKRDTFAFVATQSGTFTFFTDDGMYEKDDTYFGTLTITE